MPHLALSAATHRPPAADRGPAGSLPPTAPYAHDQPTRPNLADALDLQESEVPHTADALRHFFPDA
ncbi:hypothetical protein [Streptomyces sp. NPDC091416]|uniref:hypothetical protein n=1 Tax=Streptomyces sp. NPDC091416 TaxID=3366003 RepID=UPI00380CA2FD